MEEEKLILIDADGVMVNWIDGFHLWMKSKNYIAKTISDYRIETCYDITRKEAAVLARKYCNSEVISNLNPLPGAVEYISKLHNDYGYKFYVISSLSDDPNAIKRRKKNLQNLFGKHIFKEIKCIKCGGNKYFDLLKWKNSGLFWIEDKFENAKIGYDLGLRSILIDQIYNRNKNGNFPRAKNWEEIYNIIAKQS